MSALEPFKIMSKLEFTISMPKTSASFCRAGHTVGWPTENQSEPKLLNKSDDYIRSNSEKSNIAIEQFNVALISFLPSAVR